MNIYKKKKQWKWLLLITAVTIIVTSLWFSNLMVKKIAQDERNRITIWADAIYRKAHIVNYTENFFKKIQDEERKRAKLWAEAYKRLTRENNSSDLTFYLDIIAGNTMIPVILTDDQHHIKETKNVDFNTDSIKLLDGALKESYSLYDPIIVNYGKKKDFLYYKDSKLYTELHDVLNDLVESFFSEIVSNDASVPVIVVDSNKTKVIASGHVKEKVLVNPSLLSEALTEMADQNNPIEVVLSNYGKSYIFYKDSWLLTQLRFYPYVLLFLITLFLIIAYILFSTARKSEQNQVWVGMAKETAHQLGTPLSSLMAWLELLKSKETNKEVLQEIEKDIRRLETITKRFSSIGATTKHEKEDVIQVINHSVDYLKKRTSQKVSYTVTSSEKIIYVLLNRTLFEWVIENLCKNAIDAMEGVGSIDIHVFQGNNHVTIDFTDTGKGVAKSKFKEIFNPGYTSKQRGWGLGLSLSKRIIENYHLGKIFVKSSILNKGTTFRIILKNHIKNDL